MTALSLFEKIWRAHEVVPETAESPAVLYVDLHLTHEVTSPQAFAQLKARGLRLHRPDLTLATLDHAVPTETGQVFGGLPIRLEAAARQIGELERNAREYGFELLGLARRAARHRARDRPGARADATRHDDRLRRQPHEHAWRIRRRWLSASARRKSRTSSQRSACCNGSRRRSRSTSRAGLRPASARRTSCSHSSTASASPAARGRSSSTAAAPSARCRWKSA